MEYTSPVEMKFSRLAASEVSINHRCVMHICRVSQSTCRSRSVKVRCSRGGACSPACFCVDREIVYSAVVKLLELISSHVKTRSPIFGFADRSGRSCVTSLELVFEMKLADGLWGGLSFEIVEQVLAFLPAPDFCSYRTVLPKDDGWRSNSEILVAKEGLVCQYEREPFVPDSKLEPIILYNPLESTKRSIRGIHLQCYFGCDMPRTAMDVDAVICKYKISSSVGVIVRCWS